MESHKHDFHRKASDMIRGRAVVSWRVRMVYEDLGPAMDKGETGIIPECDGCYLDVLLWDHYFDENRQTAQWWCNTLSQLVAFPDRICDEIIFMSSEASRLKAHLPLTQLFDIPVQWKKLLKWNILASTIATPRTEKVFRTNTFAVHSNLAKFFPFFFAFSRRIFFHSIFAFTIPGAINQKHQPLCQGTPDNWYLQRGGLYIQYPFTKDILPCMKDSVCI